MDKNNAALVFILAGRGSSQNFNLAYYAVEQQFENNPIGAFYVLVEVPRFK